MAKILLVDDEPFMVEMLATYLQMKGYQTLSALNGEDALVMSRMEAPDAMILDLMLPDVEGYEVCKRVRSTETTQKLPVLILSARTAQADKDRALTAGANAYLTKPVQFPLLMSELARLLRLATFQTPPGRSNDQ